jgi:hypothetical protein
MEQKTLNLNKYRDEILSELTTLNKRVLDMMNFRMIHAVMKSEVPALKDTEKKVEAYRAKRLQKALKQANGDKKKAYALLASEDFY